MDMTRGEMMVWAAVFANQDVTKDNRNVAEFEHKGRCVAAIRKAYVMVRMLRQIADSDKMGHFLEVEEFAMFMNMMGREL